MQDIAPHALPNLGGKQRTPDHRDLHTGAAVAYDFPPTRMNEVAFASPLYYQGQRPACGAHAGTWYKTFLDAVLYTPRFAWMNIKRDGTSPSDGTDMRSIFKALQGYGSASFEPLENNVTWDDADYADTRFLTPDMLADGTKHPIASYAFLTDLSFDGLKQAIKDNGAVILLIYVNAQFWTAPDGRSSWNESDILPLRAPSDLYPRVDGHFITCHSYDENYIYFANSFGTTWGKNGHGYFGQDYLTEVLEAGFMRNPLPPVPPAPPVPELPPAPTVSDEVNSLTQAVKEIQTLPASQRAPLYEWVRKILAAIVARLLK